jgi:hypothetical protein
MAGRGGGDRGWRRPAPRGSGGRPAPPGRRPGGPPRAAPPRRPAGLGLRRLEGDDFELVHPRCVEELRPDYEEGIELWRAGEPSEARDALRFALQGCGDNLWVHVALGRIALEEFRDPMLARGHFGYAFELARNALPRDFAGSLPRDRPANRPLYEAVDGLIACDEALGRAAEAAELRGLSARWAGGD